MFRIFRSRPRSRDRENDRARDREEAWDDGEWDDEEWEEEDWEDDDPEEWEPGWEWAEQEVADDPGDVVETELTQPLRWDDHPPAEPERARSAGGVRWERPTIVATLLSRTPDRASALAVGWTLGTLLLVSALYWWGPRDLAAALPASGEAVFGRGEVWRLVTSMGAHADAIHLLSNSVLLGWLIYLSHGAFGSSLFPWSAVPAAALSLAVTLEGYPPHLRVVGASGLLYLLAGSWLTLYALVERRLSLWQRLLRVVGFSLLVLVPTSIRPEVSYRAHGIGLFFGICLGLAYFLARKDAIREGERVEWDPEERPAG